MELSKNYTPADIEEKWSRLWNEKQYFNSKPDHRKSFTVVIPPPNVTGVLHMGHTLNETVQDILVRKARMNGFNACWVPGSDHASIATEAKVVEMLKNEKHIDKNDLSRDEFLRYAFEWKEKYGGIIYHQIIKLGCSVDWNRVSFTMDAEYYKAVIKVFVDLYNKGKIYRGARMINWDPAARTALSDEEVEYREVTGTLYYIKYAIIDDSEDPELPQQFITIATQRPETIMGDSAVCANPSDHRYARLKGKSVKVPLIDRVIPVIFDDYVDPEFGTGILKITPAHDINDYSIGLKHKLGIIDTLNDDGTLSDSAQIHIGKDRFTARKLIVEELKQKGSLEKEEVYQTRIGYSQRSNVIVEPRISTQWFVKMKELAQPALDAVSDDIISIHPGDKFLATYKYWLENVKDWCISRQLWWGQQIPAWYDDQGNVYVAESEEEVKALYSPKGILTRDDDVLDTWFSSWLWPIEVFKGISNPGNEEINYYYPTSVLVTGQDIIFFWVARMIMAGFEYQKEKPFSDVYFTGMVRDKAGRKMSKQLGNSPDLLQLIEKYGADAVRFGIMISSPAGNDLLFDESSLEQGRNFNNKLWNALKLVKLWESKLEPFGNPENPNNQNAFAMGWMENRLQEVRAEVEIMYKQFRLSEALKTLYSLIWDDFCSWYLEWIKPGLDEKMNAEVYRQTISLFEDLVQLLHPFMPFITEEIFHLLKIQDTDLTIKQYPEIIRADPALLQKGTVLKTIISNVRDGKNKQNLKPKDPVKLYIETTRPEYFTVILSILSKQINASSIEFTPDPIQDAITMVVNNDKFYIVSAQPIDSGKQKEQLLKDLAHLKGFLISIDRKLSNAQFVQQAKPEVILLEKKKKEDTETRVAAIEETLSSFI